MLAALVDAPKDDAGWERFAFDNRTSHDLIRQTLAARGVVLEDAVIFPLAPDDWNGWLERHALAHQQMDAAAGGQISSDLSALDPRDPEGVAHWINIHWLEHQAVEAALGIAS